MSNFIEYETGQFVQVTKAKRKNQYNVWFTEKPADQASGVRWLGNFAESLEQLEGLPEAINVLSELRYV